MTTATLKEQSPSKATTTTTATTATTETAAVAENEKPNLNQRTNDNFLPDVTCAYMSGLAGLWPMDAIESARILGRRRSTQVAETTN